MLGIVAASLALAACGGDDGDDGVSTDGNDEVLTSSGFQEAIDAVAEEEGDDAPIFDIQLTGGGGAEFTIVDGEQLAGQVYTGGELESREVDVIGPGTLEGTDFPLSEVDSAAIDRIIEGVRSESGIDDVEITVMKLSKQNPGSDGELQWQINAEGDGRTGLVYTAEPDGSNVSSPLGDIAGGDAGGSDAPEPETSAPATPEEAQEVAECIQEAAGDVEAVRACAS
jgi:hypothetical protein